jgi:hypothetical protein
MSFASTKHTKQQDGTRIPYTAPYKFPQLFNLLDMLGLSSSPWPLYPHPGEFDPAEEARHRKQGFDGTLVRECHKG